MRADVKFGCRVERPTVSKAFSTSANADVLVIAIVGLLSLALILVPFIPGVRDIPGWIPIYKLIGRDHYRSLGTQ